MKLTNRSAALALLLGAAVAGCQSDSGMNGDATEMTAAPTTSRSAAPTAKPSAAVTEAVGDPAVTEKDMTHVLSTDAGYFNTMPTAGARPAGALKSGTKVVVMMPRGPYSQVLTGDGKRVYVATAAIKPLGS